MQLAIGIRTIQRQLCARAAITCHYATYAYVLCAGDCVQASRSGRVLAPVRWLHLQGRMRRLGVACTSGNMNTSFRDT